MKKILIALLCICTVSLTSIPSNTFAKTKTTKLEIDWGSSLFCMFPGICKITITQTETDCKVVYDDVSNNLTFEVNETSIPSEKMEFFEGSNFLFQNEYVFPDDIANGVGIMPGTIIRAGTSCPLTYQNGKYYFTVQL